MQHVAIHPDAETHVMAVAHALFEREPRNRTKRWGDLSRRTQDAYTDKAAWVLSIASQSLLSNGERPAPNQITASAFTENAKGAALASAAIEALKPFAEAARKLRPYDHDKVRLAVHAIHFRHAAEIVRLAESITNPENPA